jgi:hypothetical protein
MVMTEGSASAIPPLLKALDAIIARVQTGAIGELKYRAEDGITKLASEVFAQHCWAGSSFPNIPDSQAAVEEIGIDRFMWGSDYPHDEGTAPFTREHLRQVFRGWNEDDLRKILTLNAAELYDFDLGALAPLAAQYGPTVAELAEPLTELPAEANEALLRADAYLRAS